MRVQSQPAQLGRGIDARHLLDRQVGVLGVHVNPVNDFAQIAYDPGLTSPSTLAKQIEFSGYRATVR